jgi:tetratricopeptide (TPR) repeat protein
MMHLRALLYCAALLMAPALTGCFPGGDNHLDEEKDPHFQRGRNLASSQDFKGAVEEFERALEANPRSAAAHFELGWLYDTKINDDAAAIYHYQRHLLLQPESERAPLVNERIRGCRQQLANTEFPLPNSQNLQREVDRLTAENLLLKQQLEAVRSQSGAIALAAQSSSAGIPRPAPAPERSAQGQPQPVSAVVPAPAARRVHVIRERETIISIAAQHGIKANALMAANPNIEPRRLRIGQSLNLP